MWRLRRIGERGFNDGFHVNRREEAIGLCDLLNKMERELAGLPMYRDCIILTLDEYRRIMAERENAISDAAQSDTDSIRALHERNALREEAIGLCDLLNKMERELAEAREQRDRLANHIHALADPLAAANAQFLHSAAITSDIHAALNEAKGGSDDT
jgi:chromosome segregation ATPase